MLIFSKRNYKFNGFYIKLDSIYVYRLYNCDFYLKWIELFLLFF